MGRLLAVSDIHGHGDLLKKLLIASDYHPEKDRLVLLGDYVNKGPDSWGTLELIRDLTQQGAIALQGNNERKWMNSMPSVPTGLFDQGEHYREFLYRLPLYFRSDPYLFVHAGLRPGVPLNQQTPQDLTEIRDLFWESPAHPNYTIVFGHTSTFRFHVPPWELWMGEGKLGIDTGAGHGYYLSLVDLTNRARWFISVQFPHKIQSQGMSTR
ncbi:metallophosphoesterase [Paenibacillus amylolyticus]|uniref:metallophosphoesterase n=1 Tax=Paenibacillus amylolyticus TaxID=1451 RepID=UPI003D97F591